METIGIADQIRGESFQRLIGRQGDVRDVGKLRLGPGAARGGAGSERECSGGGEDVATSGFGAHGCLSRGQFVQPLTAPVMTPLEKYFWRKG